MHYSMALCAYTWTLGGGSHRLTHSAQQMPGEEQVPVLSPRGRGLLTGPRSTAVPSRSGCREHDTGGGRGKDTWKGLSVRGTRWEGGSVERAVPGWGHRDGGDVGDPSRHHLLIFCNCQGQGMSPGQRPPHPFPLPAVGEELPREWSHTAEGQAQVRRGQEKAPWPRSTPAPTGCAVPAWASEQEPSPVSLQ